MESFERRGRTAGKYFNKLETSAAGGKDYDMRRKEVAKD